MDTISGIGMLEAMLQGGGIGIHHRYCETGILIMASDFGGIAISPSMDMEFIASMTKNWDGRLPPIFCLDVAHGHTKRNLDFAHELIKMGAEVISGNIVTEEAAEAYLKIGVKALRVGIGSGSACTTRVVTGVGIPQLTAIQNIYDAVGNDAVIISDGGHRTTGDIIKSLAFGADFVMLGGMLAGTDEAEGTINYSGKGDVPETSSVFRGMASEGALSERKKEFFVEGTSRNVKRKGSVIKVLDNIKDAIETACYYLGATNLKELKGAEYVYVTQNGYVEGKPQ
jgi:IMP dehydrogenase